VQGNTSESADRSAGIMSYKFLQDSIFSLDDASVGSAPWDYISAGSSVSESFQFGKQKVQYPVHNGLRCIVSPSLFSLVILDLHVLAMHAFAVSWTAE